MKDKFIDFLIQKNVYDKWIININKNKKDPDDFLNEIYPFNCVRSAFDWKNTPEGYEYWLFINNSWQKTIRKVIK